MRLLSPQQIGPKQLSLDLGEAESNQQLDQTGVERSVIFPKNVQIYDVADFQHRVSQLFAPLNIQIDFRVTRHNRVEMRWSFPQEAVQYHRQDGGKTKLALSPEENEAFETLVLSFAGATH